jgi:hypothetical protein
MVIEPAGEQPMLHFRVPKEARDQLARQAKEHGLTFNAYARMIIIAAARNDALRLILVSR